MVTSHREEIPKVFWYWLMPVPIVVQLVSRQIDRDGVFFGKWIESESGIIENGTALILIPATVMAVILACRFLREHGTLYFIWFMGAALVCFTFAGEEISWGQHWFGWSSPEYFAEHNRQGETNLHNINIHFGRVVKTVLTLAIIVGGLILPFYRDRFVAEETARTRFLAVILPTYVCIPVAGFVFGVRLIERCKTWFDLEWAILAVNLKESQELYIALFLFIYIWSIRTRYR